MEILEGIFVKKDQKWVKKNPTYANIRKRATEVALSPFIHSSVTSPLVRWWCRSYLHG